MESWTVEEVCDFIRRNGFDDEVVRLFKDNKITGEVLPLLDNGDLLELGVKTLGDRKLLLKKFGVEKGSVQPQPASVQDSVVHINVAPSEVSDTSSVQDLDLDMLTSNTGGIDTVHMHEHELIDSETAADQDEYMENNDEVQLKEIIVDNTNNKPPVPVIILSADEDREIPDPFPFPVTYGSDIDAALRLGKVDPRLLAAFKSRISGIVAQYQRYPTTDTLKNVARQVMRKYPFLKNPNNDESFLTGLKDRAREYRRNRTKKTEAKIIVSRSGSIGENKPKKAKLQVQESNIVIEVPPGEDDASFARHNHALQAQAKKGRPNLTIIKELMDISFEMRRNEIIMKPSPLAELLQKFPFLGHYNQLIDEFCRIHHNERCQFNERWQKALSRIGITVKENVTATSLKSLQPYINHQDDFDEPDADTLTAKVMFTLPYLLKDHKTKPSHEHLIVSSPPTIDPNTVADDICHPAPSLILTGSQMFLVAEKKIVCTIDKFVEAPIALLAAYYVYNMSYPLGLHTFYTYLEYVILDKKPKKMTACLSHFITYCANA